MAQMIGMAGGEYVFADLTDSGNSLSTMNIPLEDLYAGVKDADVLIYNGTIEGTISTKKSCLPAARCWQSARRCKAVISGARRPAFSSRAWHWQILCWISMPFLPGKQPAPTPCIF